MARLREREPAPEGAAVLGSSRQQEQGRPQRSPQVSTSLAQLLRARAFCIGAGPQPLLSRLSGNLHSFGGDIDPAAAVYVGTEAPPQDRPSIGLGEEAGTLGPRSFGFLNNVDGVAPLAAPMAERPRQGGVALVVPRRDALPEVVPLLLSRRLGVSWLISVGDGDPAEVIRFLGVDPATTGILVALGRGSRAATLHGALPDKQTVLFELSGGAGPGLQGQLCRAVARRAGAVTVGGLEEWLAWGALFDVAAAPVSKAGPGPGPGRRTRAQVVVVGAGGDFVAGEAQRARLPAPVTVEMDDEDGQRAALQQAAVESDLVILVGDPQVTAGLGAPRPTLRVDPSQQERLRAVLQAAATRGRPAGDGKPMVVKPDADKVAGVVTGLPPPLYESGRMVQDEVLSDHDTKRLLHAYGARVSRQAPANTGTAVVRIAAKIGLPVVLVASPARGTAVVAGDEHGVVCTTQAELKRQATLLLAKAPHVMVREVFADSPQVRMTATQERGLGTVLRLGGEAALLPLLRGEARELAELWAEQHGFDPKGLTELLGQAAACAAEHGLSLDMQVHLSDEPAIVSAVATMRRPESKP